MAERRRTESEDRRRDLVIDDRRKQCRWNSWGLGTGSMLSVRPAERG